MQQRQEIKKTAFEILASQPAVPVLNVYFQGQSTILISNTVFLNNGFFVISWRIASHFTDGITNCPLRHNTKYRAISLLHFLDQQFWSFQYLSFGDSQSILRWYNAALMFLAWVLIIRFCTLLATTTEHFTGKLTCRMHCCSGVNQALHNEWIWMIVSPLSPKRN